MSDAQCFHCHEPLATSKLRARVGERSEAVCCAGCQAVVELIAGSGLDAFYRYRSGPSQRPSDAPDVWSAYGDPAVAAEFTVQRGPISSLTLIIQGLRCSACGWLIERAVGTLPGIRRISVNAASGRAVVAWQTEATELPTIMRSIAQLGYTPHPLTAASIGHVHRQERRTALKQLAVAAFGMMQVMMFAVGGYAAEWVGETLDPALSEYFRLISLLITLPVLLYAGRSYLVNAWQNVRTRCVGMDLPVGTALLLAFLASTWNTLRGSGEVYFDSITMFVFFLNLSRFTALSVRHRTNSVSDALAQHLPAIALRVQDSSFETVPLRQLQRGDTVLVRSGDVVPVDGIIVSGATLVNEAWLSGESLPLARRTGDAVSCGSINTGSPIHVCATATAQSTSLASIAALLGQAQLQKPAALRIADRYASIFLRCVLALSIVVFAAWLLIDPAKALPTVLAVLIVACPCAFSIAMPAVLGAATAELARRGVLVTRVDALETLAKVRHVILDKTGTLTHGAMTLRQCQTLGSLSKDECLGLAAALERSSEHPIAGAFKRWSGAAPAVEHITTVPGRGIEGEITGLRYRIGVPAFVHELCGAHHQHGANGTLLLGNSREILACFEISDELREDSNAAVHELQQLGIATEILSGDSMHAVRSIAQRCDIHSFTARCLPADKVARVHELQREGKIVAMLGDGINDAPVLAAADVSIAMGRGAALALAAADCVIVNERPSLVADAVVVARRSVRIARQNLLWSAAYNFTALPLAALGWIPPWAAALGMAASSILVLLNSLRLLSRAPLDAGPKSVLTAGDADEVRLERAEAPFEERQPDLVPSVLRSP
jgi:Cu2+-exporting ATPase